MSYLHVLPVANEQRLKHPTGCVGWFGYSGSGWFSADVLKEEIKSGSFDINYQHGDREETLLMRVYDNTSLQGILKHKPDVNKQDKYGWTALMHILANKDVDHFGDEVKEEMVNTMLKNKANINCRTGKGDDDLSLAICFPYKVEIFEKLIRAGADIDNRNENGQNLATGLMKRTILLDKSPRGVQQGFLHIRKLFEATLKAGGIVEFDNYENQIQALQNSSAQIDMSLLQKSISARNLESAIIRIEDHSVFSI